MSEPQVGISVSILAVDENSRAHHVEIEGLLVFVDIIRSRILSETFLRVHRHIRLPGSVTCHLYIRFIIIKK